MVALILALTKFEEFAAALDKKGLPPWSAIALIAAFPLVALVLSTIPSALEQRRIKRYAEIKVDFQAGYFTLRPRETEAGFERVDNAHQEIFRWIENAKEPVLYITGLGGHLKGSSALLVEVKGSVESTGVGREARVGVKAEIPHGRTFAF